MDFEIKEKYDFYDLVKIMALLRAPDGCPWDREQSHESIKTNLIEETYEVIEAINKQDKELLCEELGDLLMQAVFHAQIEKEQGAFDIDDVCTGIVKKLVERHPHIFGSANADTVDKVLETWEEIKAKTKNRKTVASSIASVPRELPALMRAQKVQKKAAKAGFDWDNIDGAFDKIYEELDELKEVIKEENSEKITDEFGDVLFSCVNVSRFLHIDSEQALTESTDKFAKRFERVEKKCRENNIDMPSSSVEELDKIWESVKNEA